MTRIAVLANGGRVTGGMIVWVDGALTYGYGRELDEIPPTDWDVMTTDGLTYRMLESGQAWAVQLADGDAKAHLEWHGLSPATSYDAHPHGPLPKAVAWGHYEQTCRVTGDLVVGGRHDRVRRLRPARPLLGVPPLGRACTSGTGSPASSPTAAPSTCSRSRPTAT